MRRHLPLLSALLLLAGCNPGSDEATPVGSTAPDVKLETLVLPSTTETLAKHRGRVVLMDFWATWCGPCRAITPTLEKIYAKYKDQGLDAMAISTEAHEIVSLVEKTRPHEMPVYLDTSEEASRAFGVVSLPTIMVIDRAGHVAYRTTGVGSETESLLTESVEKALETK